MMMQVSMIDSRSLNPPRLTTGVVLRLFPQADAKTVSKLSTRSELLVKSIWPRGPAPQEEGEQGEGEQGEGGEEPEEGKEEEGKEEEGKESGGGKGGGKGSGTKPKEETISVPRFVKNKDGEWVHDPKPFTWGEPFLDTRFNDGGENRQFRGRIDQNRPVNYYRTGTLKEVCMDSTWYNKLKVKKYFTKYFYVQYTGLRLHFKDMRKALYRDGNSEECHNPKVYIKWKIYQECLILRNQRMEYLIPKYPLHQMGFFYDWIIDKKQFYNLK